MSKVNLGVPPTPGGIVEGAVGIDLLEDDTMMIRHFLVQDQHFIICDSDDILIPCTYTYTFRNIFALNK